MREPALVFTRERDDRPELVVNFGVFSGREATEAEVYRLAQALLDEVDSAEVVCEQRYEFTEAAEATIYRVRVLAPNAVERAGELRNAVAAWAEDCIQERYVAP